MSNKPIGVIIRSSSTTYVHCDQCGQDVDVVATFPNAREYCGSNGATLCRPCLVAGVQQIDGRELLECGNCGLAVVRDGDKLIRACKCDAPILANISATVRAHGGLRQHPDAG